MPRAQTNKTYNTFVRGLITEAGPLTFPEDATTDELNCDLELKGNRKRRLGFNLETSSALSTQTVALTSWKDYAITTTTWKTVAGDGNTNFLVVQIGPTLYFYDLGETVLSSAQKSFTVTLTDFTAPGATNVANSRVNMTFGKGLLFVVGEKIESFYVEYDSGGDSITTTQITVEIRDFEGVDDSLDNDEEPTTLSDEHNYNLKNQGWLEPATGGTDPISAYFTSKSRYPGNNKQWWQGKDSSDNFDANLLSKFFSGNTLAPRGHYVIQAFYQDRSDVSGVSNIPVVSISARPRAVAFFQGRTFYGGVQGSNVNGHIYFSQIIEGNDQVGRCYQANDPTSEDLNDLLATDGGVIVIPEAGSVLALFALQSSLLVMADNGIWQITGTDGGFKATDYAVSKVGSIGIDSPDSIVDVDGIPVWWGKVGINTVTQNEVTDKFSVQSLSQNTIQEFYDDIPALSKVDVQGEYDEATKKIYWLYRETAPTDSLNRFRFNRVLILDTRLGAFYPWEISEFDSNPYYIGGVFRTSSLNNTTEAFNVVNGADEIVDGANDVVNTSTSTTGRDEFINFLCFTEGATTAQWTFGNFTSRTFYDWYDVDNTGVTFSSYFETGDELMQDIQRVKQAVYVTVYFNRTETAYTDTNYNAWVNPSGCYMQARWEFADHSNSAKFSPATQVYKFRRTYTPSSGTDYDSGFPVTITKNKVRGSGKALRLRFTSEDGKDFDLLGWATNFSGNTAV